MSMSRLKQWYIRHWEKIGVTGGDWKSIIKRSETWRLRKRLKQVPAVAVCHSERSRGISGYFLSLGGRKQPEMSPDLRVSYGLAGDFARHDKLAVANEL
jgi:hypothetical protein